MAQSKAQREAQRKRNINAFHCAMIRLAGHAGIDVAEFKREWLSARFGVEHSTELADRDLWDALDQANGKRQFRPPAERDSGSAAGRPRQRASRGGAPDDPASMEQIGHIRRLAFEAWGDEGDERLMRLITRQTRGRSERLEGLTEREASGIICAFKGQGHKSGLTKNRKFPLTSETALP